MYPLQPAEKSFILKLTFFLFMHVSLHIFIAKSTIISFGSRQEFTVFTSNWDTVVACVSVPRRKDKWYVSLHYDIWHFQFDKVDVF